MTTEMPRKAVRVLWSKGKRYKVLFGGRGSAKSWSVARYIVLQAYYRPVRVLCTREIQSSIKDSVHKLLADQIDQMGLSHAFNVQRDSISSLAGAEIIFKGLRHNINEVKSTEGVDICWVEEAEAVADESWQVLIPTIRKEGSEVIITFNPEDEKSATYTRFVEVEGNPVIRDDMAIAKLNYNNNKWFSDTLRLEMEYDRRVDPEKFAHVWLGMPKKYGNACIFKGKVEVRDFETPEGTQFFYGCDFGYANDPTCLVRSFIKDKCLWIDYEAYGVGVEIEELPAFFDTVPAVRRWRIVADSARPETISYLRSKGFCIDGALKGKGSVEDGIQFLRSFEKIIIHPRCKGAIGDFSNYKWKVDRVTSAILPIPVDASNHTQDSLRYSLEDYIRADVPMVTIL
jgi:phage terminase large subunit